MIVILLLLYFIKCCKAVDFILFLHRCCCFWFVDIVLLVLMCLLLYCCRFFHPMLVWFVFLSSFFDFVCPFLFVVAFGVLCCIVVSVISWCSIVVILYPNFHFPRTYLLTLAFYLFNHSQSYNWILNSIIILGLW